MKKIALILVFSACLSPALIAQTKPAQTKPETAKPDPAKPDTSNATKIIIPGLAEAGASDEIVTLITSWIRSWNSLDGTEAATERFASLYTPDATHEVGIPEKPLGPEFFAAPDGIRKMAEEFGKLHVEVAYHLEISTANERAIEILYVSPLPGGGNAIAVPYTGAYTVRATKRRFFYPGVAVMQVNAAGKITHVRFYQDRDQIAEVRP